MNTTENLTQGQLKAIALKQFLGEDFFIQFTILYNIVRYIQV